jgi:hypothetical protein
VACAEYLRLRSEMRLANADYRGLMRISLEGKTAREAIEALRESSLAEMKRDASYAMVCGEKPSVKATLRRAKSRRDLDRRPLPAKTKLD